MATVGSTHWGRRLFSVGLVSRLRAMLPEYDTGMSTRQLGYQYSAATAQEQQPHNNTMIDSVINTNPATDGDVITDASVAAVVCTFANERFEQLVAAVRSLHDQRLQPDEIIVVIDHNPALLERVRQELRSRLPANGDGAPRLIVIANAHARGLSGGRNTALELTTCAFVAFLDDDAEADESWLLTLRSRFGTPNVVGVGGRVEPMWAGARRPPWFPPEMDWTVGCTYRGVPSETSVVRNPFGGAMMVRADAVRSAGGYSEQLGRTGSYPSGGEETELCIRMRERDPSIVLLFEPGTCIYHQVPRQRMSLRYLLLRCYAEGRSKAVVRRLSRGRSTLATERSYALRTLPAGVIEGLVAARHGDTDAMRRAGVLVLGLFAAVAGFGAQTVRSAGDARGAGRSGHGRAGR